MTNSDEPKILTEQDCLIALMVSITIADVPCVQNDRHVPDLPQTRLGGHLLVCHCS